jgi:hypothetical protein
VQSITCVTDVSRAVTVAIHIERTGGEEQADNVQQQHRQLLLVPAEEGAARLTETVKNTHLEVL